MLTWNIQYGRRSGRDLNSWPERAPLLVHALQDAAPDIFCAQEVLAGQLREIAAAMPGHEFVATGRDDGRNAGEHCPIFFDKQRFALVDSGTFWLSDTPEVPSRTWGNKYHRICTWARLRPRGGGGGFVVLNTHFPLQQEHRKLAAALLAKKARELSQEPALVVGDFNEPLGPAALTALTEAGLADCYDLSGERSDWGTYRFRGITVARIDWIMATSAWKAESIRVVHGKTGEVYASDHNGVLATLALASP